VCGVRLSEDYVFLVSFMTGEIQGFVSVGALWCLAYSYFVPQPDPNPMGTLAIGLGVIIIGGFFVGLAFLLLYLYLKREFKRIAYARLLMIEFLLTFFAGTVLVKLGPSFAASVLFWIALWSATALLAPIRAFGVTGKRFMEIGGFVAYLAIVIVMGFPEIVYAVLTGPQSAMASLLQVGGALSGGASVFGSGAR